MVKQAWWQRGVIYQIYPRSFNDTSGNGIGDLQGIIAKLDYLNDGTPDSLGIDAIWISPFYPSSMADFGYDVSDYCDVDPLFGDLAAFDRLVAEAHRRGIKVIIDYVPNHSSDRHPWFVESRSSRANPKRDWYIWRDPRPDGGLPNNWGSAFGGPAWSWDEGSGQYYLHQFLKEQPELNWRNPQLRAAMMEVLRFWLERGVDGFRMDVVSMIVKDAELRDNPPDPQADPALPPNEIYRRQLHLYNEDQNEVHGILRDFRRLLANYQDRCLIGEVLDYGLSRWVRYYGPDGSELHLPFNFRLMKQPWRAQVIRSSVDELEVILLPFAWPNYVLGSHDVPRLASRLAPAQARVAAMLLLTLRGTPTLYYGDELGLENGLIPSDKLQDPQGLRLGAQRSRDPARTPMQWDGGPQAGFSVAQPWLPVSADYRVRNVAAQSADPSSLLNLYRRLLWYRRARPCLQGGSYRALDAGSNDCFLYLREHPSQRCLVALNFSGRVRHLTIPRETGGVVVISTYLDREETVSLASLALRPHEGVIVKLD